MTVKGAFATYLVIIRLLLKNGEALTTRGSKGWEGSNEAENRNLFCNPDKQP
jgi:hypothetical protein